MNTSYLFERGSATLRRSTGMVWIPGGTFLMGSDQHYHEEAPAHKASVNGFWMDQFAVTNAEFRRFVEATDYVTFVERPANPADYQQSELARQQHSPAASRHSGRRPIWPASRPVEAFDAARTAC